MHPIKTASTLERILRHGGVALMVLVFGAYFLYDGYLGYPKMNLAETRKELPPENQHSVTFDRRITEEVARRLKTGLEFVEVERELGPPAWKGPQPERGNKAVWFGPGGCLIIRYNTAGILGRDAEWKTGPKTETDLRVQLILGYLLTPLGALLLLRVLTMPLVGVTLSDAGLKPSGRAIIPYDDMVDWDTADYKEKGRIHLRYRQNGAERTFTLDDYKLAAFRPIVEEIVRRKGFPNPLTPPEDAAAKA